MVNTSWPNLQKGRIMSDKWNLYEGEIVDGKFPLVRYLGGSEHSAVFLTERHEGVRPVRAAIKLIPAVPEICELQLSRWRQTAELSHPHLIPLYEMGRFELRGMPLVYVVMECAEENLAQVLPGRALTPAEAREMLDSILEVLTYLHRKGFVHGRIKPANVMASGDQLKVSSDSLRRLGETLDIPSDQNAYDPPEITLGVVPMSQAISPAGDVWSLGMTLVETLTQKLPVVRTAKQQDPLFSQSLPEPFIDIARHCLIRHAYGRWTVAQIAARLEERTPITQVQAIPRKVPASSPGPAQRSVAQRSRLYANLRKYATPIAIGLTLVLAAILEGPTLLRRHPDAPQIPVAVSEPPLVPAPTSKLPPSPQKHSAKADASSIAKHERSSKAPVPVPASIHQGTMDEKESDIVARAPSGSLVRGEVAQQVMPEVPQSARNTIRGKVGVSVKLNVDRSGNVEDAELASQGPSKYFARVALAAAQDWRFKPPMISGQGVLSSWTLRFEFTRDGTRVVPTQEMP
jgi:TonB family protein